MDLEQEIRALYRENPKISGMEILQRTGRRNTAQFWKCLNRVQVGMRGIYPDRHKNRSKSFLWRSNES